MSLIDNVKNLFKRESVSSNIGTRKPSLKTRISLRTGKNKMSYELGMKILSDSQVATGFDILKYLLSSKQWVLVANENDTDNVVYNFINDMLFNMETELMEIVKQEVTAVPWGYCVHELIFDLNEHGQIYLKNALPLHIKTLQNEPFVYDDNGDLVGIYQEYKDEQVTLPINKCLKYSFNANFDEDYGHGLLYDFRPIVEDKMNINDWLMTFLERHESPTLYGKVSNTTSKAAMLTAFDDVADGTTGITVGVDEDVGVLESSHRGETFFKTLEYKDNEIFRRYYLGNLLLGSQSTTGSYAQSQTQLEFGKIVFDGILEEIANCLQRQVINNIVEWNFGDITLSPTFGFDKFTTGDLAGLFNVVKPLIDSGVVDSENKAVQDSIALMFKKETGLIYSNEDETNMPDEEFGYQEPVGNEDVTTEILDNLTDVYAEQG